MVRRVFVAFAVFLAAAGQAIAQQNRIDVVTPMAPECAAYGPAPDWRTHDHGDRWRPG